MIKYLKYVLISLLTVIIVGISLIAVYNNITSYTFSTTVKNGLTTNYKIYREAGKSYLELSRIANEEYEWPISREKKVNGGINIFDDKRFVILALKETRRIDTDEAFVKNEGFNSYQLHSIESKITKHVKAVKQLKKEKENCLDWYF